MEFVVKTGLARREGATLSLCDGSLCVTGLNQCVMTDIKKRLRRWRGLLRKGVARFLRRLGWRRAFLRMRDPGYAVLAGRGLEIGAFEHPARVPHGCQVSYVDVITPEKAGELFPEIDASSLVPVDYLVDLDTEGLAPIASESQDFVIACHVIEHVANPGRLVAEMVRVVKPGGHVVIAAPDRDYTFDRRRSSTPLERLHTYYRDGRGLVGPGDYLEMLQAVHPELMLEPTKTVEAALRDYHRRREHLSVWTAREFREFLSAAFSWSGADMELSYEVFSDRNRFEYFGVWRRAG